MKENYKNQQEQLSKYLAGEITATELKPHFAVFGIYEQKNHMFMTRLRVIAGHLPAEHAKKFAEICSVAKPSYLHISTRQNLQLHDVSPELVIPTMQKAEEAGLPFLGGGGNTFRSIKGSILAGQRKDSIFDTKPFAKLLNEMFANWEHAYCLPRKLKIGFFDSPRENNLAIMQDLGFVAQIKDNEFGFKVYIAGGIGRNPSPGILLFDFIAGDHAPQIAYALCEMFYVHGNRENRNTARIRYLLKDLGEEQFRNIFNQFFSQAQEEIPATWPKEEHDSPIPEKHILEKIEVPESFDYWKRLNVVDAADDFCAIRVRVPKGNMSLEHFQKIANMLEEYKLSGIQFTECQDFYIEQVDPELLPHIYKELENIFQGIDFGLNSFRGHLISCVGSTVCKVGIGDSPNLADRLAQELDIFFAEKPHLKVKFADRIINEVRISGCASSCSLHAVATIGLSGMIRRDTEGNTVYYWQPHYKTNSQDLMATSEKELIPDIDAPKVILEKIKELIIKE